MTVSTGAARLGPTRRLRSAVVTGLAGTSLDDANGAGSGSAGAVSTASVSAGAVSGAASWASSTTSGDAVLGIDRAVENVRHGSFRQRRQDSRVEARCLAQQHRLTAGIGDESDGSWIERAL